MSGDPTKASLWADADVYIGATDAENPADVDAVFGGDWDLVGLLDGDEGFAQQRSEDVNDHFAWGGVLVRTSRAHYKQTVMFTALEYNDVTRALIWPGSDAGEISVPRPARLKVAFETREGDKVHRLISAFEAEVSIVDDIVDQEDDLTRYALAATIFPTAAGLLFYEQATEDGS